MHEKDTRARAHTPPHTHTPKCWWSLYLNLAQEQQTLGGTIRPQQREAAGIAGFLGMRRQSQPSERDEFTKMMGTIDETATTTQMEGGLKAMSQRD